MHKRLEQQLRLHLQSVRDRPLVLPRGAGEVQSVQIVSQFFRAGARCACLLLSFPLVQKSLAMQRVHVHLFD